MTLWLYDRELHIYMVVWYCVASVGSRIALRNTRSCSVLVLVRSRIALLNADAISTSIGVCISAKLSACYKSELPHALNHGNLISLSFDGEFIFLCEYVITCIVQPMELCSRMWGSAMYMVLCVYVADCTTKRFTCFSASSHVSWRRYVFLM